MKNTNKLVDLTELNCKTIIEKKTTPEGTRIIIILAEPRVNDKRFRKWESSHRWDEGMLWDKAVQHAYQAIYLDFNKRDGEFQEWCL